MTKWSAIYGWISPTSDLPEDMKPLMVRFNNGIYANWRHVQRGVKMEVGLNVDFIVEADDNGLQATDIGTTGISAGSVEDSYKAVQKALGGIRTIAEEEPIPEAKDEQDMDWGVEEESEPPPPAKASMAKAGMADMPKAGIAKAGMAKASAAELSDWSQAESQEAAQEQEEPPLPPGWEAIWSDEHQSYYYWHKATKQPSWERPVAEPAPAAGKNGNKSGKGGSMAANMAALKACMAGKGGCAGKGAVTAEEGGAGQQEGFDGCKGRGNPWAKGGKPAAAEGGQFAYGGNAGKPGGKAAFCAGGGKGKKQGWWGEKGW